MINDSISHKITYYLILPAISPNIQDIRLISPKLWALDCFETLAANRNVKVIGIFRDFQYFFFQA